MIIKVLDRATLGMDLSFEQLSKIGNTEIYDNTPKEELEKRISDADVIIINKIIINNEILEKAKNLKLICVFATGYDNVDIISARKHGVAVCNVPAYSTDSVALFTISTVLSLYTHLFEYKNHVASGKYTNEGKSNCVTPIYHELRGRVWGIIGFGNIGRAVAKIADAFGAKVIVNKRKPIEDYECVDLKTLCKESDIITIHCPLNESTRGMINEENIKLMKKNVVLVNEARGAVLDEEAVAKAVISGDIAAFGCDVFSSEPFRKEHPYDRIKELDNVCLTPHAAWGAYEARMRCLGVICDNIKSFADGKTLNRVDI